jgi:hypothetical protein
MFAPVSQRIGRGDSLPIGISDNTRADSTISVAREATGNHAMN